MKIKTQSYTFRWAAFEPGEYVASTSHRCPLPPGVYEVLEYKDPIIPFEQYGTVVVQVNNTRFSLSTEYLTLSEPPRTKEPVCANCGEPIGYQSTAAATVKFGDFEFCSDLCHEQWLDALQDKNEQKYGDEAD